MRPGLWGQALAEADGNEDKAKARYIEMRVQSMMDEAHLIKEEQRVLQHRQHELQRLEEKEKKKLGCGMILFYTLLFSAAFLWPFFLIIYGQE